MSRNSCPTSAVPAYVGLAGIMGLLVAVAVWAIWPMPALLAAGSVLMLTGAPMWILEWRRQHAQRAPGAEVAVGTDIPLPQRRQWRLRGVCMGALPWVLTLWFFETFSRWVISGFWGFLGVALPFLLIALVRYLAMNPASAPHGLELVGKWCTDRTGPFPWGPMRDQLVKAYFLPIMLGFVFDWTAFWVLRNGKPDPLDWYALPHVAIYFVDVVFGTVGYLSTSRHLGSHIRSSNPYWLAWIAALSCYVPFGAWIQDAGLQYKDGIEWHHLIPEGITFYAWGGAILAANAIYTWATVSFGIRFSNLTHRGIITNGPYRFTKHPAYLSKNLSWWMVSVPFISAAGPRVAAMHCAALVAINLVYFARAKTEEWHLMQDPVYREYSAWMAEHGLFAKLRRALRLGRGPAAA